MELTLNRWFWVKDEHRGKGLMTKLLAEARDCAGAHIDTFSAEAVRAFPDEFVVSVDLRPKRCE